MDPMHRGTDGVFVRVPGGSPVVAPCAEPRPADQDDPPAPRDVWTSLLDGLPGGAALLDDAGIILAANAPLAWKTGLTPAELAGRRIADMFLSDGPALDEALARDAGTPAVAVVAVPPGPGGFADGRDPATPYEVSLGARTRLPGEGWGRLLLCRDPSLSRQAEQRLRDSEQRLSAHLQRTPLAAIEWTVDRRVVRWNPAAERVFGYRREEVDNRDPFPLLVADESREHVDRIWAALVADAGGESSINTNRTKDGRTILCQWYNSALRDKEGRVIGVASLAMDITDRELAERELRVSQKRLATLVQKLPVLVWAMDDSLRPVLWNEHAERITGYAARDIMNDDRWLTKLVPMGEERRRLRLAWRRLGGGDYDDWEVEVACADGVHKRIAWSNIAARCPIPGWRAWGVGVDVTERRRAERALSESERRFRDVFENTGLAGVVIDQEGRVAHVNDALLHLTGWERQDVIGRGWTDRFVPVERRVHVRDELRRAFAGLPLEPRAEAEVLTRSGQRRVIAWTRSALRDRGGGVVAVTGLGIDVTERRHAEHAEAAQRRELERIVRERTAQLEESHRQLAAARRLAALGEISAGIGHDIGNILLPMRCHLDSLGRAILASGTAEDARASDFKGIRAGLEFLDQLGGGLRGLSAQQAPQPCVEAVSLADWWAECEALLARTVADRAALSAEFPADLPCVCLPRHLLLQAVLNVVVNAAEAIVAARRPGGRITLSARPAGESVRVCVEDNGIGMTPDVAERALEPFFTTKRRALSTGMGLALVNGALTQVGGSVEIDSTPGVGTAVTLVMPARPVQPPAAHAPAAAAPMHAPRAAITLRHPRSAALHRAVLSTVGCAVEQMPADAAPPPGATLWIVDADIGRDALLAFLDQSPQRRAVLVGPPEQALEHPRCITVTPTAGFRDLRRLYAFAEPTNGTHP